LSFDGSVPPNCSANGDPEYKEHSTNCSRFWRCSGEGSLCLKECSQCPGGSSDPQCEGQDSLTFDSSYQYPEGPVCGLPSTTECSVSCNVADTGTECCSLTDCPGNGFCLDYLCIYEETTTAISTTFTTTTTSTTTTSTMTSTTATNSTTAIIITGGFQASTKVEILRENGGYWCSLPDLPDERYSHTQSGLITCGGGATSDSWTSCLSFTNGQWVTSHQLQQSRYQHSSWMSQHGVLLVGGSDSGNSTEKLTENGGSTQAFTLEYDISSACTIELDNQVIVTGGFNSPTKVNVYTMDGWIMDLPDLDARTGRYSHGCGHYSNSDGKMVYLVTGGWSGSGYLSSTEVLVDGAASWAFAGELPKAMSDLKGVSLNNEILMTGGIGEGEQDYILQFNVDDGSWTQVGQLQASRARHGASVINAEDVIDYCV